MSPTVFVHFLYRTVRLSSPFPIKIFSACLSAFTILISNMVILCTSSTDTTPYMFLSPTCLIFFVDHPRRRHLIDTSHQHPCKEEKLQKEFNLIFQEHVEPPPSSVDPEAPTEERVCGTGFSYDHCSTNLVHSRGKYVSLDNSKATIGKKSLLFLLQNMFVCRNGFSPALISLRDPTMDSRMEKSSAHIARTVNGDDKTEKADDGSKWVKTDSECLSHLLHKYYKKLNEEKLVGISNEEFDSIVGGKNKGNWPNVELEMENLGKGIGTEITMSDSTNSKRAADRENRDGSGSESMNRIVNILFHLRTPVHQHIRVCLCQIARMLITKELRSLGAPKFLGEEGEVPMDADLWLNDVMVMLESLQCSDHEKLGGAVSLL
ncbi:hypothetical protein F3Y22_tig00112487pilonHSYRG00040 [Hibiscus syriacus]|uniref:Uncharacterized protein n=1 Tax=Hibiscus syriacus TaxID=106335 RepID=A0A6A2XIC4_HIBSY|nr:hypothetical protein F3Y22_tig00112487pilonHSYRG00040 [Hibiscus syriacus]